MKLAPNLAPSWLTLLSVLSTACGGCTPSATSESDHGPQTGPVQDSELAQTNDLSVDQVTTERTNAGDDSSAASTHPLTPRARPIAVPRPAGPYRVRIVDASLHDLRMFRQDGRSYVLGTVGERYAIVLSNPTAQRVEAVVSVDGLDAIDGASADYARNRGYILPAYGSATIEGFRTSLDQVATFRFSSVADSYAGRLGKARDVGVIGVAFFPERVPTAVVPAFRPPATRPREDHERESSSTGAAPRPRSASPAAEATAAPPPMGAANGAAASAERYRGEDERKGLGTEYGEARNSHVDEIEFARANPVAPAQVVVFRYNDRSGLAALGIRIDPPVVSDRELQTRETAEPFRANRFAAPPP